MVVTPRKTRSRTKPAELARLTRDDWLDAAFQAVVDGGFDAVRVLTLAQRLGVTRGSFYWHFADHAELVQALLARWHARELESDRLLQSSISDDAEHDLEVLLDAALAHAGADLENMRFELALRGLGRRDAEVARMLAAVDQMRVRQGQQRFQRLTGDEKVAAELASLFYLAIVGSHQALSRPGNPPRLKEYLRSVIARHLIQPHRSPRPVDPTPVQSK